MRAKRPAKLTRPRWLLAAGVSGAAVVGALGWIAFASPLLELQEVEVSGLQRVESAQVVDISGARPGTPLARVDVSAVRERVGGLRAVESVEVRRAWPSTLRIAVRERVPVAAVPAGDGYALLDREGVRVATVPDPEADLPTVRIAGSGAEAPAASRTAGRSANRAALRVLGALPERVAGNVDRIAVGDEGGVTLRLQGGATVTWGQPKHSAQKARTLTTLLRRHDAKSYDVSSLEIVTVD